MLSRTFLVKDQSGTQQVELTVLAPVPRDSDFGCEIRIVGGGLDRKATLCGVDSIQALLLALRFARQMLVHDSLKANKTLYWLEEGDDLGLDG